MRAREPTDIVILRFYVTRMSGEGLLIKVGYGRYRVTKREAARCRYAHRHSEHVVDI